MNMLASAFPAPASLAQYVVDLKTATWNRVVGRRWMRCEALDTDKALAFIHPTKGFRLVSKRRLGL